MLVRKTNNKKRKSYTYSFEDYGSKQQCIIESGKNDVTEEHIKLLHSLDDSEIYNNLKNSHPAPEQWQKDSIKQWEVDFSEKFKIQNGRIPSKDEISIVLEDVYCDTWVASLDEITDGNSLTEGIGDKNMLLSSSNENNEQLSASIERLHEVILSLKDDWQDIYNDFYIIGLSKTEIAAKNGVSETYIRKILKKIITIISNDKVLITLMQQ